MQKKVNVVMKEWRGGLEGRGAHGGGAGPRLPARGAAADGDMRAQGRRPCSPQHNIT